MQCWTELPDAVRDFAAPRRALAAGQGRPGYDPDYFDRIRQVVRHSRPALGREGR